jgi:protein-S-isoprenylcysteine O-methyltransferase Ste14
MCILMAALLFPIGFIASFAGYLLHTRLHYANRCGRRERLSPGMEAIATLVIFFGYAGWGLMLATDPVPLDVGILAAVLGGFVGAAGIVLFLLAIYALHGFRGEKGLMKTGVYARSRHPMYFGIILIHLGFPVLFGSALTLLSAVLWIPQILLWARWEEEELEERFGDDYRAYRKKTLI